jgi:glycosyltransferase involved in cell wall biosynthesis
VNLESLIASEKTPCVSVGIPTYNRPDGLRRTLECITGQTYANLEIIVSDNCSPGYETEAVVREFMEKDNRIQYYRQDTNKGMGHNFMFVCEKATSKYFMWAADDDEWDADFVSVLVRYLENHPETGMAFTDAELIDGFGRSIFKYSNLHLLSGKNSFKTIIKYTMKAGVDGKANLVYALFRKDIVDEVNRISINYPTTYGMDVPAVLGGIIRGGIYIEPRIMFRKRVQRETDRIDTVIPLHYNRYLDRCPLSKFGEYFTGHVAEARRTKFLWVVVICMIPELILSVFSYILMGIVRCVRGGIKNMRALL